MKNEPEWYKSGWHQAHVKKYSREQPSYQLLAENLEQVFKAACKQLGVWATVQSRVKTVSSFAEKILRKYNNYKDKDPLKVVTDLAGVCIMTLTQDDADVVAQFIENEPDLEVDRKNSVDLHTRLRPNEFGYRAVHYIVSVYAPSILGVSFSPGLRGLKAEIQIQTMLQHTWAKIGHDRIYKAELNVPQALEREVNCVSALLEEGDTKFSEVIKALDIYTSDFHTYMDDDRLRNEIRKLEAVNECDEHDVEVGHRLAMLYAASEKLNEAEKLLTKIAIDESSQDTSVWRDLGYVRCRNDKLLSGRQALKIAIKIDPKNVRAVCDLGDTYIDRDVKKAFEYYRAAFIACPNEPCTLAHYLECLICVKKNIDLLEPLRGALKVAIVECVKRVDMEVDMPNSSFYIGRFYLFMGEPYESLQAYAKAVASCSYFARIQDELRAVERICSAVSNKALAGIEWIRRFLVISVMAKVKLEEMRESKNSSGSSRGARGKRKTSHKLKEMMSYEEELKRIIHRSKSKIRYQQPVVIVAGGCDRSLEKNLEKRYGKLLKETFHHYEGTIICGGTRAGVSKMVGDLPNPDGKIHKIAYLPKPTKMPKKDREHKAYRIKRTDGDGYTPLGPIHTWAELLLAGLNPCDVRILGINGGRLTAFEYRLALAMGAKVGLIETSGRAVSDLLPDFDWKKMKEILIPLPEDGTTLAAFVNAGKLPSSKMGDEDRIKAGKAQHKNYVEDNLHNKRRMHPSMLPWDKLGSDYQNSNIHQIAYAERILRALGWDIIRVQKDMIPMPPNVQLYRQNIRAMAELEHGRYNAERLCSGWRQGEDEPEEKTNPSLTPWKHLKAAIRRYDYKAVAEWPLIFAWAGLKVIPTTDVSGKHQGQEKPVPQGFKKGKPTQDDLYEIIVNQPEWKLYQEDMKKYMEQLTSEDEKAEKQQQ